MSSLWRSIYSKSVYSKLLTFVTSKDTKVCDVARRNASSVTKSEKSDKYVPLKPWVSYGFDEEDKRTDRHIMHTVLFGIVSVALVCGGTILFFLPDPRLRDWAQREAYIQLRYREENGLPLIDPNLIDPSKFTLPSDEELQFADIII